MRPFEIATFNNRFSRQCDSIVTPQELAKALKHAKYDRPEVLARILRYLRPIVDRRVPVDSGDLRASHKERRASDGSEGAIYTRSDYAQAVHDGSRPHLIRPRNVSLLRFETAGGAVVYTTLVRHPGTRPQPYLKEAIIEGQDGAIRIAVEGLQKMASEIARGG